MPSSGPRIVVVEDSCDLRELLVLLLEAEGFSVFPCQDADQAFATIQRDRPNLIVTDLMLGASNGLDLITRVRSDLAPPVPPIVVCSGFPGFESEALDRGAAAFIPKPFEPETILRTISAILARGEITQQERDDAAARARSLRARSVAAAVGVARRLEPRRDDVLRRAYWTTRLLPRYFGFGESFALIVHEEGLQVSASSNERIWKRGQGLDIELCRDIVETGSAIVVPDLQLFGTGVHTPGGRVLRFFAGVPLSSGSVTVGALCFLDEQPRRLWSDGFSVLEALGQRASAVLSNREMEITPAWMPSGLMTRDMFCVLLAAELSRMARERVSLNVLVFASRAPGRQASEGTVIAELSDRRFAALFARDNDPDLRGALSGLIGELARAGDFDGGGLVSVESGANAPFDARGVLCAAEGLLEGALRGTPGTIERVVVRQERLTIASVEA